MGSHRRVAAFFFVFSLAAGLLPSALASAQGASGPEIEVSPQAADRATHIVNATVLETGSVDRGTQVHTVSRLQIDVRIVGSISGEILVEVPGGQRADGTVVFVSEQPELRVGDEAQVALVAAPTAEAEAIATALDRPSSPVFSIVGGRDGTAVLSGGEGGGVVGVNDYLFTGNQWLTGDLPIHYRINVAGSGVGTTASINAINRAFLDWENDPNSDFDVTYDGTTTVPGSGAIANQSVNVVAWVDTPNPADSWLAQATWFTDGTSTVSFDILYNNDFSWSDGAVPGSFDVETVALHESGHVIGLGHVGASSEIMYGSVSSNTTKGLGSGDRTGVGVLYPATSQDPARVAAAAGIVTGLQSFAATNGDYVVIGGGWQGGGDGAFGFSNGTSYPDSIANVMATQGFFPGGVPVDPSARDFLIYRCADRVGVFADTDAATSDPSSANWWAANNCTNYPTNAGYTHLTLSNPGPGTDPARVAAAAGIVTGLQSFAATNGDYVVIGGGWQGGGEGAFGFSNGTSYPDSIANVMATQGFFPGGVPVDPSARDFLIYPCADRVGVFADTDAATSDPSSANWWAANNCTNYPTNAGYTHLTLSNPGPGTDPARVAAAAGIVTGLQSFAATNGDYVVIGGGWQGGGEGAFGFSNGTSYPDSIANVMATQGFFPGGVPVDPSARDFLIYRCADRVGVFADTDAATSDPSSANWWAANNCTNYPTNAGYTHLTLSNPA